MQKFWITPQESNNRAIREQLDWTGRRTGTGERGSGSTRDRADNDFGGFRTPKPIKWKIATKLIPSLIHPNAVESK
jgi:hypothetical protein